MVKDGEDYFGLQTTNLKNVDLTFQDAKQRQKVEVFKNKIQVEQNVYHLTKRVGISGWNANGIVIY